MKVTLNDLDGKIIRDNDTYIVEDNNYLKNLIISKTTLHVGKHTNGHRHENVDEVYFFLSGAGNIQIDDEVISVYNNDVVMIPHGKYHKVVNTGDTDLIFVCIFQSYQR